MKIAGWIIALLLLTTTSNAQTPLGYCLGNYRDPVCGLERQMQEQERQNQRRHEELLQEQRRQNSQSPGRFQINPIQINPIR